MTWLLPKSTAGFLAAILVANLFLFAGIMHPKPAEAVLGIGDIVFSPVEFAQAIGKFIWEKAKWVYDKAKDLREEAYRLWRQFKSNNGVIAEIVSSLLLTTMHVALGRLTNDIVAWINGGGKGKIRVLQDPGKFLTDALDGAGGVLAGAILNVDPRTLCNADFLRLKLKIAFAGPYAVPTFDEKVACTFSGMADGLRRFQNDFEEGGWAAFIKYTEKPNNRIGQTLITAEEMQRIKSEKSAEAVAELGISKGFLAQKKCVVTKGRSGSESFDSRFIGRDVESVIEDAGGLFRGYNVEEFKGYWVQQGGAFQCKTVTPAEQISELTTTALQAPIRKLEDAITGLTEKLGTGAGSVLKPYVLAIASAALNQLLKKEKGLVAAAFQRPQKPRRATRQYSGSLQENALLGSSATAISGSVNDFRTFLLKALLDFNIFATSAAVTSSQADLSLGRLPIDEPNYDATSCVGPTTTVTGYPTGVDPVSNVLVTDPTIFSAPTSCFTDDRYGWRSDGRGRYGPGWFISGNTGWPIVADSTSGTRNFGAGDPTQPYLIRYNASDPSKVDLLQPAGEQPNNVYTLSPGKMFKEEAEWCGAFFEEIPVGDAATQSDAYSTEIVDVDPQNVCVDDRAGIWYELSGTTGNIYLSGASPGGEFFHNCAESTHADPDPSSSSGRVLGYTFDWSSFGSDVSSLTFTASNSICSATATITPSMLTQGFLGSGCGGGSGPRLEPLGLVGSANIVGTRRIETVLERYFSPTFEGGTITLLNKKETFTSTSGGFIAPLEVNSNDALLLRGNFYPELSEKMRELMEKSHVIEGYHYPATNIKDYLSPLSDQLGTVPDDDPLDNSAKSAVYSDRNVTMPRERCSWPNSWDTTTNTCFVEGYKGSVSDVLTRYNELNQTFQALFAGLQDENSLEGVDKDLKILTPEENNIRFALIGQRCPALPPSATSSPELMQKCPVLSSGEYNMARKFVFEPDRPGGITTGFATNPFTQEQSSALAGFLNLEDMATQLGTLPPNKNIVKLIRMRQLLEQLQVGAPQPLPVPGKPGIVLAPRPLTGVDVVQVDVPGYERIRDWLNDTTTRNKHIQELIAAYGYTSAEEAYPQISRELDDILDELANQITDKLKDVFLKRTELALEEARLNAQHRLMRFVEYTRDLNSDLKLEIENASSGSGPKARILAVLGATLGNSLFVPIENTADVLKLNARTLGLFDPNWASPTTPSTINTLLGTGGLNDGEKRALIDSAIYKIRTLAAFIGIDTNSPRFNSLIKAYNTSAGTTEQQLTDDVNLRVKKALRDIYILYTVLTDLENGVPGGVCLSATASEPARCMLTQQNTDGTDFVVYKDARIKLTELKNDFSLMLEEIDKIKEEYQDLLTFVSENQRAIDDMASLFQTMMDDYDQANRCFGFPTDPNSLWMPPASVRASYGISGAMIYGTLVSFAVAGAGMGLAALLGASIATAAALTLIPGIGLLASLGLGSWLSRRKKKKAERRAKEALQRQLRECAQGIDDFNRHMGQLAGNFVCGKVNKKYEDR